MKCRTGNVTKYEGRGFGINLFHSLRLNNELNAIEISPMPFPIYNCSAQRAHCDVVAGSGCCAHVRAEESALVLMPQVPDVSALQFQPVT